MRSRPARRLATSPASDNVTRCLLTAWRDTDAPSVSRTMDCGPSLDPLGGGGQFFGGGGGGRFRRGIDEETLKEIADMTDGAYYAPESADELQAVFRSLPTYLITKHETTEISVVFTAIGALLATMAIVFSLFWHPLP